MLVCKCVIKQREDRPRYAKTVNNFFLEAVSSNIFCKNWVFKSILMKLSAKVVGEERFFTTFLK